eukprot:COSAG05_NODE_2461_length_3032_cov_20.500479_4_plen_286_part_00
MISCPIRAGASGQLKVSLNLEGAGADAVCTVSMLTEQFAPIPGYTEDLSVGVSNGLRSIVRWHVVGADDEGGRSDDDADQPPITELVDLPSTTASGRVRVKVSLSGARASELKLFAIYVDDPTALAERAADGARPGCAAAIPELYEPPPNADELLAAAERGNDHAAPTPTATATATAATTAFEGGFEVLSLAESKAVEEVDTTLCPVSINTAAVVATGGGGAVAEASVPQTQEQPDLVVGGEAMVAKLLELKDLLDAGYLTAEEFSRAKGALIPAAAAAAARIQA